MKKIKLFLLSAAIIAAGSAFITKPATTDEYVKDGQDWVLKTTVDGITGNCIELDNMHCSFVLNPNATQPYQDSDFTPVDENQAWQGF